VEDAERYRKMDSEEALSPERAARLEEEEERTLPAFFRYVDLVFKVLITVVLCALVFTVGANVFGRFVLNYSLPWADELSRYLFIWLIFVGAALAYFRGEHISVEFLVNKLPRRGIHALHLLRDLVVLGLLALLLRGAVPIIQATMGDRSALLGVPLWWVYLSVPVAAVLMVAMCLYSIVQDVRGLARGGEV
jgi:TRAP-type transport system small permease protein